MRWHQHHRRIYVRLTITATYSRDPPDSQMSATSHSSMYLNNPSISFINDILLHNRKYRDATARLQTARGLDTHKTRTNDKYHEYVPLKARTPFDREDDKTKNRARNAISKRAQGDRNPIAEWPISARLEATREKRANKNDNYTTADTVWSSPPRPVTNL